MAIFYNSVIAYDSATTPYNGVATVYTYAGNITVSFILNHNIFDGAHFVFNYTGRMVFNFNVGSPYVRGFLKVPTTTGLTYRLVPNSSMVIRQYKNYADPVRIGGCVFCGTYLYNE